MALTKRTNRIMIGNGMYAIQEYEGSFLLEEKLFVNAHMLYRVWYGKNTVTVSYYDWDKVTEHHVTVHERGLHVGLHEVKVIVNNKVVTSFTDRY